MHRARFAHMADQHGLKPVDEFVAGHIGVPWTEPRPLIAAAETEHYLCYPAHLNFLCPLSNAIAAMMAVNMLEWPVARIADTAMHLHRTVGGITDQAIRTIVAHRDLIRELARHLRL